MNQEQLNLIQVPDNVLAANQQRAAERSAEQARIEAEGAADRARIAEGAARVGLSHMVETDANVNAGQTVTEADRPAPIQLTQEQVGPQGIRQAASVGTVDALGGRYYSIPVQEQNQQQG